MLRQSIIAAATALAMGAGAMAVTATPAAADNYGFYFSDRGFGVYGGDGPRHPPPPPRYKRYSDNGCWAWSKRLQQRVWVCGPPRKGPPPPHRYQGGQGYDWN
ncbi:MAG: hypothetical protein J0H63_00770 [Rhizobiales bacterium]|nr:hypothetical protein [Hyphomicrobiales bacterium]MBN9008705.1 hypothetical protein [Hyphomicrobiales bacterium]